MASTSFKQSLKRQRSTSFGNDSTKTRINQKIGGFGNLILMKNTIRVAYGWQPSINEQKTFCDNASRGRFIQNRKLSFRAMLVGLTTILLSIRNTSGFVNGELDHHRLSRDTRNDLNLVWEEVEEEGNDTFLSQSWGRNIKQGGYTANKGRDLLGETYIQQQNATNSTGEILPTVRIDQSSKPPSETNVTSNPLSKLPADGPTKLVDYSESIKKGNPLIQSTLPINFRVELVVRDAITNQLLKGLETTLENYIQTEYQMLVDRGSIGNKKLLKLGLVDLTLSLVESKWLEDRRWRRLSYNSNVSVRGSSRSWQRKTQESGQNSNTKILTISVNGSVNYSMEVDGSAPTPDDIEKQWSEAYMDLTSQNQLQRAIEDANIQGVVRLEDVTQEDGSAAGGSTNNANQGGSANAGDLASLYENEAPENFNESSGNDTETSDGTETTSKKSSQLERPSTLSIIFGFILTGIAVAGLFVYAYLFYRKRKKRLKKKKKMKETITFSSAGPAVPPAAPPPNKNQNSLYYSKSPSQSAPPIQHSSQAYLNSMMLTQTESEETTYRGLESSVGSEDTSDPFANELKLAASLDEEAWNESKRVKETIEKRQAAPPVLNNSTVSQNRSPNINATVPSLLSDGPMSLEEEDEVDGTGFGGNAEWVESYPYGDEAQGGRRDNVNKTDVQSSSAEWEPYNSALPPLVEEKKDETNPSEFFAQKLKNIENDLSASREKPVEKPRIEPSISDDVSDILSEVSEISKYVRRYERRKDRKIKREEQLNERLAVRETPPYSSAKKSFSVERDGRFHREPNNTYESPSPSPSQPKRLEPYPLSSYAGSFRDAKTQDALQESLSVVSDDAVDPEDISMRSQRLGITPYSRSKDEVFYEDGSLRKNDKSSSNRTGTTSTRSRSTRTEDDYRYTVGYTRDPNKSPSRLAHLRANDAIIDNSNSEVNVNYGISQIPNVIPKLNNQNSSWAANKPSNPAEKKEPVPAANPQPSNKPRPTSTNKRFDKLRGMFEQKTNAQPAPIYPPGANWQNGGSLGK